MIYLLDNQTEDDWTLLVKNENKTFLSSSSHILGTLCSRGKKNQSFSRNDSLRNRPPFMVPGPSPSTTLGRDRQRDSSYVVCTTRAGGDISTTCTLPPPRRLRPFITHCCSADMIATHYLDPPLRTHRSAGSSPSAGTDVSLNKTF